MTTRRFRSWRLFLRKVCWFTAALSVVVAVRAGLSLLGYKTLARLLPSRAWERETPKAILDRCAWAVTRASRLVPSATCLTQAIAAKSLLSMLNYPSTVVVGVAGGLNAADFKAHAWLESGGVVVLGGATERLSEFNRLTELGRS